MVTTVERPEIRDIDTAATSSMRPEPRAPHWQRQLSKIMGNAAPSDGFQAVKVHHSSAVPKPRGGDRGGRANGRHTAYAAIMGYRSPQTRTAVREPGREAPLADALPQRVTNRWKALIQKGEGYLALFLIGAISWGCQTLARWPKLGKRRPTRRYPQKVCKQSGGVPSL